MAEWLGPVRDEQWVNVTRRADVFGCIPLHTMAAKYRFRFQPGYLIVAES